MQIIEIRQPDDWHVHLRDGAMLNSVVNFTAHQFARAIVMPNLDPPVTSTALAQAYRQRILAALEPGQSFIPLMTIYLTDDANTNDIAEGFAQGVVSACKLYPAHATTNSAKGVTDLKLIYPALERMQRIGMPLLIHGEVTEHDIDIFDREAVFLERKLTQLVRDFPELKIVLEHITTKEAKAFVEAAGDRVAATITPHHLQFSRNAIFEGGIRPHYYCLPIAKREVHRLALRAAATSGNPKFFLGTDSAPHGIGAKETACGCAGIFNAPVALACYAQVFEEENALHRLEGFASEFGPRFYGLPLNSSRVRLRKTPQQVAATLMAAEASVVPYRSSETLAWRFDGSI